MVPNDMRPPRALAELQWTILFGGGCGMGTERNGEESWCPTRPVLHDIRFTRVKNQGARQ